MNQSYHNTLACASILSPHGINYELFLRNLPDDGTLKAVVPLVKERVLRPSGDNILFDPNRVEATDLSAACENPEDVLIFLAGMLKEMMDCPCVEENRDYISVLHTFQNACKQFCGRNEELDDQLAELLASLVNLLDVPMIHFAKKDMDFEAYDRRHLDVLRSAEASLALKTLDRGLDEEEDSARKLGLCRFTYDSLQLVSALLHGPLSPDESTESVDQLIRVVEDKVSEWEAVVEIKTALYELEKECGSLSDNH